MGDVTEYITRQILKVRQLDPLEAELLSRFTPELVRILIALEIRLLQDLSDIKILKFLETCYDCALCTGGSLHTDNHFGPLPWPNAPGFDDEYHRRLRAQDSWVQFWLDRLNECESGPTLFCPLQQFVGPLAFDRAPRYLFRVYDHMSSGHTDSDTAASPMACADSLDAKRGSRKDFYAPRSIPNSSKLMDHLDRSRRGALADDNFVSWSSSLLFAIQYAIWRSENLLIPPAQVFICAVDTTKFPLGQFARDLLLVEDILQTVESPDHGLEPHFQLRAGWGRQYDNGEYLSQGRTLLTGRSCTFSLEAISISGLMRLYPEFQDTRVDKTKWPKRVAELRTMWNDRRFCTSDREVGLAEKIARTCFPSFRQRNIVELILAFKDRGRWSEDELQPAKWAAGGHSWSWQPVEVERADRVVAAIDRSVVGRDLKTRSFKDYCDLGTVLNMIQERLDS